jgi:hypothetical protein
MAVPLDKKEKDFMRKILMSSNKDRENLAS